MNVAASPELCKQLYALSGWTDTDLETWGSQDEDAVPAYNLGFLIRKLPPVTKIMRTGNNGEVFAATYSDLKLTFQGNIPENCAARLAIALFENGTIGGES